MTEDEMVGWHHWLNRHEFEQALGVGGGQESLECCSLRGHKELDLTEWLNWTEKKFFFLTYLSKHFFGDLEFSSHSSVHGMDYVFCNMLHLINVNCTFGFPGGSAGKESACNARGLGSIYPIYIIYFCYIYLFTCFPLRYNGHMKLH